MADQVDKQTDLDLVTDHPYQPSEWGDICGHDVNGWPCGFGVGDHSGRNQNSPAQPPPP